MVRIQTAKHLKPYLIVGALLLATVWGAGYWAATGEGNRRSEQATLDVERAALQVAEHVALTFQYADSYLKTARELYRMNGMAAVNAHLEAVPMARSIISHITIIDSHGKPLLVSGYKIKPGSSAKDRGYFKFQESNFTDSAFVSPPKRGRNSGKILARLVRRITTADGDFAGVIFAAIDVEQLSQQFLSLDLGPQSGITVVGTDKKVRVHVCNLNDDHDYYATELDYSDPKLWQMIDTNPTGLFQGVSPVDGIFRLTAYRQLTSFPLAVVVGVSLDHLTMTVGAYQQTTYMAAGAASILIVILIVLMARGAQTTLALEQTSVPLETNDSHRAGVMIPIGQV